MRPYGKKKRGRKLHPHNECGTCSEDRKLGKGQARADAKKDVRKEVDDRDL